MSPSCVDTFIFSVTKVDKNYNFRKESSKNILIILSTVLKIKINKKYKFYENKFPNLREKSCKFMRKKDIILRESTRKFILYFVTKGHTFLIIKLVM